jgi:arginine deiminase
MLENQQIYHKDNNNNSTLVENIIANREDLDYEFKEEIKEFVEELEIKELILKSFSKLVIINCNSTKNKTNFSRALERILIYFFLPAFNKK